MSDNVFKFEIVTPEATGFSCDATRVDVPGENGMFGVLALHAPMISGLAQGIVSVLRQGQDPKRFYVSGGFAEVTPDRCTILATFLKDLDDVTSAALDEELAVLQNHYDVMLDGDQKDKEYMRIEQLKGLREAI